MDVQIVEDVDMATLQETITNLRNQGYKYIGELTYNPSTKSMVQVMECDFITEGNIVPPSKVKKPKVKKESKPICGTCNIPLIEDMCPICNNTCNKDVHVPIQGTKICASCIQNYNDELTACPKCQCTTVVPNAVDAAKEKERLAKLHEW